MPFELDKAVPWGRRMDEYIAMFNLTRDDLGKTILGCGDGPASFNYEASHLGYRVISCDPLYAFTAAAIAARIDATYDTIMEQLRLNMDQFVWTHFTSPEHLGQVRMEAMRLFLEDYERGKSEGRYVAAALPDLPFRDKHFGLALVSHFLFLYSEQFSEAFHVASVRELCRVADEIRIYPIRNLANQDSPYIEAVQRAANEEGFAVEIVEVDYEFQKGGRSMLHIHRIP